MTNPHPIAPPPELWSHWYEVSRGDVAKLATRAAQWGADMELEACCEWIDADSVMAAELHAARRPKPPSLKEQALELARPAGTAGAHVTFGPEELALIYRALEQLDD